MKKLFICFSLFIFSFSLCSAQDTIVFDDGVKIAGTVISVGDKINFKDVNGKKHHPYREVVSYIRYATGKIDTINPYAAKYSNVPLDTIVLRHGPKMGVKIISFGDKIVYTLPQNSTEYFIWRSHIKYIKYADGAIYTVAGARDSAIGSHKFYISITGGVNMPFFQGYGGNSYNDDDVEYAYSGYAYNGSAFCATSGFKFYSGWEITGKFSYLQNGFDPNGVYDETYDIFIRNTLPGGLAYYPMPGGSISGNYSYSNYAILAGFTKNTEDKYGGFGFNILAGQLITYRPAVYGTSGNNYTMNLLAETHSNFIVDLGMHLDAKIVKHIFFRASLDLLLSGVTNGGTYQLVDNSTGKVIYSNNYSGNSNYPSFYNIDLITATLGLGYEF
jgi:hypothetical protein